MTELAKPHFSDCVFDSLLPTSNSVVSVCYHVFPTDVQYTSQPSVVCSLWIGHQNYCTIQQS